MTTLIRVLAWFGVHVDTITRADAARDILGQPVTIRWHPVILTDPPRGE